MEKEIKSYPTIEDIIDYFCERVEAAVLDVSKMVGSESKIKIGHHLLHFNSAKNALADNLNGCNQILKEYCTLLSGKELSINTFKELNKLVDGAADGDIALRIAYLKHNKISIPSFPNFKMEKLVEAYDFPVDVIDSIGEIQNLSSLLAPGNYQEYFNEKTKEFELNNDQLQQLKDKYAVYMSSEQMAKILNLTLLCASLNATREAPYVFTQLPEIDNSLIKFLSIDRSSAKDLELNIQAIKDQLNLPDYTQIGIRSKPKFKGSLVK